MIRIIVQTQDVNDVFHANAGSPTVTYKTVDIEHPELEALLTSGTTHVSIRAIGAEVVPIPK